MEQRHHSGKDQEEDDNEISKSFVWSIFWRIQKLAAPLLIKPFDIASGPIDDDDLGFLERKLGRIRATLSDADVRLDTSLESVKLWLRELRDLESCIVDIIEELEFESRWRPNMVKLRSKLRESERSNKRKRDEISFFLSSSPRKSLHLKIENLRNLYNEIAFDRKALRLREGDGVIRPCRHPQLESTSFPAENINDFYGRENELKEVLCSLFSEASHQHGSSIVAIVGMAGVGKTTLTQHVFNHNEVLSHFDERIWICLSEGLTVEKVIRNIRDNLTKESRGPSESSLELLLNDVSKQLFGKRFLMVFDDVWNKDLWRSCWEVIETPLKRGEKGSRVIVTTRDTRVAGSLGAARTHRLSCLSDADCWSICQKHALNGQKNEHHDLVQRIKEISRNCKGLPLAAKMLGYLLRSNSNEGCLRKVLQSDDLCLDELINMMLDFLRPSYDHLPFHLKRCFAYCSLLPKNYVFEKNQLIWLWMAQALIEPIEEHIGNKYFNELVERTLVQCDDKEEKYLMHDLFLELAQFIANNEFKKTDDLDLCKVDKNTRHFSLIPHDSHRQDEVEFKLTERLDLRSLLIFSRSHGNNSPFHVKISSDLFQLLQCLRALDLGDTNVHELPVSIGNLIHLRYLGLRNTKIKSLPESVCCLFKLQKLDLRQCHDLQSLPEGIKLLSNLRAELLLQDPPQIGISVSTQNILVNEICVSSVGCKSQGAC